MLSLIINFYGDIMKLNKIFTSHMVFAANKPIRIFGEGRGLVTINFNGITKKYFSDNDEWIVEFPALSYGGPYSMSVEFEGETVNLEDIYIGEVYLFAGQSNMQFKMNDSNSASELYQTNSRLRLYSPDKIEKSEYYKANDGWVLCEKDMVGEWSAIAYLTSKIISEKKDIAIGVIVCYQGASVIESWVPEGTFEQIGIKLAIEDKYFDHTYEEFSAWNGDGTLYNVMLSQIIPYSLSSVIWYQGESDTSEAEGRVYCDELAELIRCWRNAFYDIALPFVVVQIADFIPRKQEGWVLVQQAQIDVQSRISGVITVISRDICETDDIHPKSKSKLSERIADVLLDFQNAI